MAFEQRQRQEYERRIRQMMDDGFFLPSGRTLSGDIRYLIISFGGTGADALFGVKKAFETVLPAQQLAERVRFLAIDTDEKTQRSTREIKNADGTSQMMEVDDLKSDQFFFLNFRDAGDIVTHPCLDPNVARWINPHLVERIKHDIQYFGGSDVRGIRQIGRLALYPANTVNTLSQRITTLARELTDGNTADLRVFILTGIAGGTGSGTVIDLSYLIRDAIPKHLTNRVRFCGFVLLPPTGKGSSWAGVERGNANGYAAMKEINRFMTLKQRGDRYSFTYGNGHTVESGEPIFDTCYLLDGLPSNMDGTRPRENAVRALSEGLLEMVTSGQAVIEALVQPFDLFMKDVSAYINHMVADKPASVAPRDADYIYCTLGHSEFSFPANEIKAYVGKQLFDKIYYQFRKCSDVDEKDAKEFVDRVLRRGAASPVLARRSMEKELETLFTDRCYGPFYVINLLASVADEAGNRGARFWNFRSRETLAWIEDYALTLSEETFTAYTCALDGLKHLMETQFGAVVKTEKGVRKYSFMPVSLGRSENTHYVITYLDRLINSAALRKLCDDLLQEMIDNRENWVALIQTDPSAKHDAPAAMRNFWNEKLDAMVNATLEDFLIKFYTGDPDAHYSPEKDAATRPYLKKAAEAICDRMLDSCAGAQPQVEITSGGLDADDFSGHTFLMVPESAHHLYEALVDTVRNRRMARGGVTVCKSLAVDRISCLKRYCGIPAFKLAWTQTAEKAYENVLNTAAGVGLHISETDDNLF